MVFFWANKILVEKNINIMIIKVNFFITVRFKLNLACKYYFIKT